MQLFAKWWWFMVIQKKYWLHIIVILVQCNLIINESIDIGYTFKLMQIRWSLMKTMAKVFSACYLYYIWIFIIYFIMCNILHGSFQYLIGIHINSLIYCSVRSTTLNTDWRVSYLVYRVLFLHSGTWEVARADRRDNSRNQASPHRALQSPVWWGKKVHQSSMTNSICLTMLKMTTNLCVKIYVQACIAIQK